MSGDINSALRAVNQRFYDHFAGDFDRSRERPWPGWGRVVDRLSTATPAVLDTGCGNGRFGVFLAARLRGAFRYLGVDGCAALLRAAGSRLDGLVEAAELRRLDILEPGFDRAVGGERFDLVVLFGVLHHIPGRDSRSHLLRRLGSRLAPGGVLAVSVWRPDRRTPRFARRIVAWQGYNRERRRRGLDPLDLDAAEAGDTLLSWAGDTEHPRYCHFPDDTEIDQWIATPGPRLSDRFEADGPSGRDNLYLVWQNPAAPTK